MRWLRPGTRSPSGLLHFYDSNIEGLTVCSVNQRLINRPFVLFPAELTWEEKSYYRPFQFQANDETQAGDLLNWQCTSFIRGSYAVFIAAKALGRAKPPDQAPSIRSWLVKKSRSSPWLADRLRLLNAFYLNVMHAMKLQEIIDRTDFSVPPEVSPGAGQSTPTRGCSVRVATACGDRQYPRYHLLDRRPRAPDAGDGPHTRAGGYLHVEPANDRPTAAKNRHHGRRWTASVLL